MIGRHPFDGAIPYPWHRDEADALYNALFWGIQQQARADMVVHAVAPTLPPLTQGVASAVMWKEALDRIAIAGVLLPFCRHLLGLSDVPQVVTAAQGVLDARPVTGRYRMGGSGLPVLDRTQLRRHLGKLADDAQQVKTIVVRGEPKSGKSWGRYLFLGLARDRGARQYYVFNGSVASVGDLVTRLFELLERPDLEPPQDSTVRAWYQVVCHRLAVAAQSSKRPLWIVVDDLGPGPDGVDLLDKDVKEFCNEFGRQLLNPAISEWFRLMLVHYPGEVPTHWDGETYAEDRPQENDVATEHVREALAEWALDNGRTMLDEDRDRRADEIIAAADRPGAGPAPRLRRIKDELVKAYDDLAAQS